MKDKKSSHSKTKFSTNNCWMENPYQDMVEADSLGCNVMKKKKQYFAHTDNNLKGISNLTKDEDLIIANLDEKVKPIQNQKQHRNESCSKDKDLNSYYFYPQKFTKQDPDTLGDLVVL